MGVLFVLYLPTQEQNQHGYELTLCVINIMTGLYNNTIICYFLIKEIEQQVKKINRLIPHVEKCKKEEDRAKLVALIAIKTSYVSAIVMKIQNEVYELKGGLMPSY